MEGAEKATAVEGAKDLLAWLDIKEEGPCPHAVVSRNCRDSIVLAAERCGITLPPVTLSREDPYVKPDPRALALAAERLGVPLSDCVMVGDFIFDLQAAQNAGIPFVLVRGAVSGDTPKEWESEADFPYATVADFVHSLKTFTRRFPEHESG
jgi:phosphoglycolate phosphatase-like HAD superfamily hydrolase